MQATSKAPVEYRSNRVLLPDTPFDATQKITVLDCDCVSSKVGRKSTLNSVFKIFDVTV